MTFLVILSAVLGAIIGSFLSVCIGRIPFHRSVGLVEDLKEYAASENKPVEEFIPAQALRHQSLSINSPRRSECPTCGQQLLWWHNLPVISWLLLKGRCAFCSTPISVRYPLLEVASAGCAILSLNHFGPSIAALVTFVVCATFLAIAVIDYDWYIIPNLISYPGAVISVLLVGANQAFRFLPAPYVSTLTEAALGVLFGAGFLWVVAFLYKKVRKQDGLGLGDVKLLVMIGALFGPSGALFTIFGGSVLGTLGGIFMILVKGRTMAQPLPFGPFLLLAATVFIFLPQPFNLFPGL
jgi:leader peptidase (prepilin peptidase)/N-methyltransferase